MTGYRTAYTDEIDRLRKINKELLEACQKAVDRPLEVRAIMESNGIIIDNLKNKMQKFSFTLYTMIVETATEAEDLISKGGG